MTQIENGESTLESLETSQVLNQLQSKLEAWKSTMSSFRTANLWFMYMDSLAILRLLMRSSRVGSWQLYIQSLQAMLPYMAAAGHNNYVNSLVLF